MTTIYFALIGLFFALIFAIAWKGMTLIMADPLRHRLDRLQTRHEAQADKAGGRLTRLLIGLARYTADKGNHTIQARLNYAGWRAPTALALFYGCKTILLFLFPLFLLPPMLIKLHQVDSHALLWMLIAATAGFYLPNFVLSHTVGKRQRDIFNSIPNTIELVTISVEAGLGLDAAIMRVAKSMQGQDSALRQEFEILLTELNAAITRESALRNLVARTGVEELQTLTTLLIQADRFGISVGESLRAYTAMLHVRRQQRAEEEAAKIAVKLLFPLVLSIFPVLIMVLIGPGGIQIYRILLPTLAGQS